MRKGRDLIKHKIHNNQMKKVNVKIGGATKISINWVCKRDIGRINWFNSER